MLDGLMGMVRDRNGASQGCRVANICVLCIAFCNRSSTRTPLVVRQLATPNVPNRSKTGEKECQKSCKKGQKGLSSVKDPFQTFQIVPKPGFMNSRTPKLGVRVVGWGWKPPVYQDPGPGSQRLAMPCVCVCVLSVLWLTFGSRVVLS